MRTDLASIKVSELQYSIYSKIYFGSKNFIGHSQLVKSMIIRPDEKYENLKIAISISRTCDLILAHSVDRSPSNN